MSPREVSSNCEDVGRLLFDITQGTHFMETLQPSCLTTVITPYDPETGSNNWSCNHNQYGDYTCYLFKDANNSAFCVPRFERVFRFTRSRGNGTITTALLLQLRPCHYIFVGETSYYLQTRDAIEFIETLYHEGRFYHTVSTGNDTCFLDMRTLVKTSDMNLWLARCEVSNEPVFEPYDERQARQADVLEMWQ